GEADSLQDWIISTLAQYCTFPQNGIESSKQGINIIPTAAQLLISVTKNRPIPQILTGVANAKSSGDRGVDVAMLDVELSIKGEKLITNCGIFF
uniref:Uncharacterized protein n=1 Tax=Romanomermis culicivorax TaxID=13658 RepID=A0A915IDW4_ROMCU